MRHLLTASLLTLGVSSCISTLPESPQDALDSATDSAALHDPGCDDLSNLVGLSLFDANGDEFDDSLLVHQNGAWCVAINYGSGLRTQERVLVTPPTDASRFRYALGDLDGDGDTDLAWGQATEHNRYLNLSVALWEDGAWTPVSDAPLLTNTPSSDLCALDELVIADLDGDEQDEIVVVDRDNVRWCARDLYGETLGEEVVWFSGQGSDIATALAGRVDGDDCDDLIGFYQPITDRNLESWMDGRWKIVGPSSEHPTADCTPVGERDGAVNWRHGAEDFGADAVYTAVQDVDGDRLGDALYVNAVGEWHVARGSAASQDWAFVADTAFTMSLGSDAELFASGDLNGDGLTDLLQLDVATGSFACALGGSVVLGVCDGDLFAL
jgi:hypothetical protein